MKTIAIITEKNQVSEPMAKAMGWSKSAMGFEGTWKGARVILVPAKGHLLTLPSPDDLQPGLGWHNPTMLSPIPRKKVPVPIVDGPDVKGKPIKSYLDNIKKALDQADEVILATDSDREGEYIGWSILEYFNCRLPVKRCWLAGGMDSDSMRKALENLLPPHEKKSLARAAEARAHCDHGYIYIVRLMSHYGQYALLGDYLGRGESARDKVISMGRVQTAALYMIYKREMAIRNFVPQTFFNVNGDFSIQGANLVAEYEPKVTREIIDSMPAGVTWRPQGLEGENKMDAPLFTSKLHIDQFKARLERAASQSKVLEYSEGTKEKHPPITYNLVGVLADVVKATKLSADVAQAVIEDLNEQGYISYSRTDKSELPNSLYVASERNPLINSVMNLPGLTGAAQQAMAIHNGQDPKYKAFKPKCFTDKKLEHHGIIPSLRAVDAQGLASMYPKKAVKGKVSHTAHHMQAAYRLIAERFIQALLPPAKYATQKITFQVPVEDMLGAPVSNFSAKAERTVDPGWQGIMGTSSAKTAELPRLKNNEPAKLIEVILKEGQTKAPGRYTDVNFFVALQNAAREVDDPEMRKYLNDGTDKPEGIGTPATRKEIIPVIMARGYIHAEKGAFFLDPKGKELIEFLMKHGKHSMYRIETTAMWEGKLAELALIEDDNVAIRVRDQFIEETFGGLDGYIGWMNEMFATVEKKALPRTPGKVTDKMKAAIKSIAERKGIKLPPGTLTDPKKASDFLTEHSRPRSEGGEFSLSDAQAGFLAKIEAAAGVKASDEVKADRKLFDEFVTKHKPALDAQYKSQPPSEKMIKFAKSLASKLADDKQPDPRVFTEMDACRKFIDAQLAGDKAGGAKSGNGTGKASGSKPAAKRK